ncbi:MFS transporter [Leifsonia sp. NPDC080035]|uniref:MFS transporter n=1 Tax=Leifsonia sp. NPDC080035 TaxID=3143936 RepID=A0AAU7GGG9_9MICO
MTGGRGGRSAAVTVAVLCLVQFVDVLGVTSVVTAIPAILTGVRADPAAAGPLATTYAMFFGATLIIGARLGDRYGHRRILLIGIVIFGGISILGGTASGIVAILIVRSVQGAAAALSAPSALRLILHTVTDAAKRDRAIAAWSASGAAAGATGFLVGGALTSAIGWQAVFWVNVPVAAALVALVVGFARDEPPQHERVRLDILGAVLLVMSVMPLIGGAALLEQKGALLPAIGLIVLAGLFATAFVLRMRTAAAPLIPRAAFASRNLRRGTVQSFANTAATSSSAVLATLVLQDLIELPAVLAGLTLMVFSIAVVAGSAATARVATALGPDRLAAAGLALVAIGTLVLAVTIGSVAGMVAGLATSGLGLAAASVAATRTGTAVPAALTGSAAGIVNTGAQLGTAIGTAVIVLVATAFGTPTGWAAAAVIALACAVWCVVRPRQEAEETVTALP